ncbi:MAG: carbon storage regulator [Planctomycetota bacterium]|nr:MAG: carbon storage regulator [Planctomycetota bacterium]REJ96189.1 MAG: carbon storage regulator [Planctomycetota bacterium]REK29344.1 MAG: carbon storage regulator [Planctomycetota bacterium]REK44188.1 MAG: carbon storage regulator [Planctomycetota bacterium]
MLVLSRKTRQSICISKNIDITVIEVRGDRVRLGIAAPDDISVRRGELPQQVNQLQKADSNG